LIRRPRTSIVPPVPTEQALFDLELAMAAAEEILDGRRSVGPDEETEDAMDLLAWAEQLSAESYDRLA
jgi:hypothetical protein